MPTEKAATLSRIYQGRVSGLKLLEPKTIDGEAVFNDRRDAILWGHHAEFQRAVNYHQFQLLRLSMDETSPLGKIRKRMLVADVATRRLRAKDWSDEREKRDLHILAEHDVWNDFRRDGRWRPGLCSSVAEAVGISKDSPLAEAFEVMGRQSDDPEVPAELYDLAVQALVTDLGGDGAIRNKGNEYLPRFCWSGFMGDYPRSEAARSKTDVQDSLPERLYDPETARKPGVLQRELAIQNFAKLNKNGSTWNRARCLKLLN